ncbi:hypothetical protein BCV70DRAFT_57086 [Testicularia cyperi]|uniref:Uncharacterized protein n=1 Tax=Testicularia cyperi TaxID=1882483 RepID=A0A317XVI7_9BASI|nr:hypothetical protein BCV70DRAFT_57086 [Testicularia cyperi]
MGSRTRMSLSGFATTSNSPIPPRISACGIRRVPPPTISLPLSLSPSLPLSLSLSLTCTAPSGHHPPSTASPDRQEHPCDTDAVELHRSFFSLKLNMKAASVVQMAGRVETKKGIPVTKRNEQTPRVRDG